MAWLGGLADQPGRNAGRKSARLGHLLFLHLHGECDQKPLPFYMVLLKACHEQHLLQVFSSKSLKDL